MEKYHSVLEAQFPYLALLRRECWKRASVTKQLELGTVRDCRESVMKNLQLRTAGDCRASVTKNLQLRTAGDCRASVTNDSRLGTAANNDLGIQKCRIMSY